MDKDTNKRFSFEEILDQDAQQKAYDEIISINKNDKFTPQNIKDMKYLTNCFKEGLRLYLPVGYFARQNKKDIKIRDKFVKNGSGIVVAPWLIHRHENFWKNPHEFIPERHENKIEKEKYLPFGLGERVCIGQGFAMQEAIIILSNILREFKLELQDGFVPDVVGRITIRSANGMMIKMSKRN